MAVVRVDWQDIQTSVLTDPVKSTLGCLTSATHLPTPEGWKAELAVITVDWLDIQTPVLADPV